jgi:dipeptidyl aminopeptidase/acylaminoacyl peptidase
MAKGWDETFIHGGQGYRSDFAPQPLANGGVVVLLMSDRPGSRAAIKAHPDAPGELGEAVAVIEQFKAARREMEKRGLIDPARVGVMGFSRSSWMVDVMITHENEMPLWKAAVSVDSGIYNYGGFSMGGLSRRSAIAMYSGPPYQRSLTAWREWAPGFNAHRVRTPLLMDYHGGTSHGSEFFTALRMQGKPVEMLFFPAAKHIMEFPSERIASMQYTVDWFRFWLQDFERGEPLASLHETREEVAMQYERWRKLREMHAWNESLIASGRNPAQEYIDRSTASRLHAQ